jgi:hypothetical protein
MPRGGSREGSGRKKGAPNKATAALQAEVAASGVTPLEVMLANMRFAHCQADALEKRLDEAESETMIELLGEIAHFRGIAQKCAVDCANYIHPRLASVQHGGDPDSPLKLEGGPVSDVERLQVMAAVLGENPKLQPLLLKMLNGAPRDH